MNITDLINSIKQIALSQSTVRSATDGDVYTNWNSGEIEYSSVNIAISAVSRSENAVTFTLYLYYGDRLMQDESNYNAICVDAENTLNSIINSLPGNVYKPYEIVFFKQRFLDYLAGGYVSFQYTVESDLGDCVLDEYITPSETLEIHSNGVFDVSDYDYVDVNVPAPQINLQEKTISDITQTILPDEGFQGLSRVNIGSEPEGVWVDSILPPEYTEVEYIQSTGYAYIPLNYYARTKSTYIYVDFEKTANNTSWCPIIGQENSIRYGVYSSSSGSNTGCAWLGSEQNDVFYSYSCKIGERNKIFFGDGILKVNDVVIGQKYTSYNMISQYSMTLNAAPSGVDKYRGTYSYGKFYNVKIYEYETLVREYIPCVRKADNVIGLYEIMQGIFYPKQGGGNFIVGSEVYRGCYEYNITSDGTYSIEDKIISINTQGEILAYNANGNYLLGNSLIKVNVV